MFPNSVPPVKSGQLPGPTCSILHPVGGTRHTPDRSGLPSDVRGAGAARSGFPVANLGIPGVANSRNCASSGNEIAIAINEASHIVISESYSQTARKTKKKMTEIFLMCRRLWQCGRCISGGCRHV